MLFCNGWKITHCVWFCGLKILHMIGQNKFYTNCNTLIIIIVIITTTTIIIIDSSSLRNRVSGHRLPSSMFYLITLHVAVRLYLFILPGGEWNKVHHSVGCVLALWSSVLGL